MIAHEEHLPRSWSIDLTRLGVGGLEATAWVVLLLLTAVVHLARLGSPPLNMDEGRRALEAYTLARDGRVAYEGAPILTNLNSMVFALFTDGDLQARLIPALAGIALVATPILLRPALTGWGSLFAGLALASSTILLTASRSVSPAVPAALCLMLVAIGAWRFPQEPGYGWLTLALTAGFVGLGFDTSFVVGFGGLVLGYAISEGELFGGASWWQPMRRYGPRALAIALLVAVLCNTRLMMNPAGLQAGLVDPLWRWYSDIARGAGLVAPLLVLFLDGGIVVLAVVGLFDLKRMPRAVRFLGTWLLVSLTLAALMKMPDLRFLVHPILPAALLAGLGLRRLAIWIADGGTTRAILIGLVGLVPVVTTAFQINTGLRNNLWPWGAASVIFIGGIVLVGLLAFNLLRGSQLGAAFATWLLVILLVGAIASGSRALAARGEDRGQFVEQTVATPELNGIRETALKWYRADPDGTLPVDASLRPLLAWSLRDIPTVRYDPSARTQPVARLLADAPTESGPNVETVQVVVGYLSDWPTLSLQANRVWRWMANRESLTTLRPYAIVVVQPAGR